MESTDQGMNTKSSSRRGHWKWLLVLPVAVAGVYVASAYAFGGAGLKCPGFGELGGSPEEQKAKMQQRLDRILTEIKATPSQRTAIEAIAQRLHSEMEPILQNHHSLHEKLVQAFSGQVVDATTVNVAREEAKALFDRGTQLFTKAFVDIGNVLDMGQRQAVLKFFEKQHGRHRFHF